MRRRELSLWLAGLGVPPGALAGLPEPLLAKNAPASIDPKGYLVSEKLDGVRALWDGQTLKFRSGRSIAAPGWFVAALPPLALDGELWMGRRSFERLSAAVRRTEPLDAEWRDVSYQVFELPQGRGPFAQRAAQIKALVAGLQGNVVRAVEQRDLRDAAALRAWLKAVVAEGGEGLMLHRADAPVVQGRSDVLLKLKPTMDAEAVVLAHVPGQGRFAGQLGALEVQTPEGVRFKLGTGFSEAQRREPPPVGSKVSYRYRDLTDAGVPRFASFLRVADEF